MSVILVATNLHPEGDRAIVCGANLAQQLGGQLIVAHVTDRPPEQHPRLQQELDARVEGLPVLATCRLLSGPEDEVLLHEARTVGACVIVLGAHRYDLLRELFGKSMVEELIEDTRRPILAAGPAEVDRYRRLLAAVDFSEASARAVARAARLLPDAEMHLIHAYHVPFEGFLGQDQTRLDLRREAEDKMRTMVMQNYPRWNAGSAEELLQRCAVREGETIAVVDGERQRLEADLLVIGTHGQSGIFSDPLGTTARAFLEDPPCDVLAVQ